MTTMPERTVSSTLTSVIDLAAILADIEQKKGPKERGRRIRDFNELKEVINSEGDDKKGKSKSVEKKSFKVLGYELVDHRDNKRKTPITISEAYPTFNVNGEQFNMLMRPTYSDHQLLDPINHCLPVKVLGEYDRFLLVEVCPHWSKQGFVSETYKLCVNKHDFFCGRILFVKETVADKKSN